MLLGNAVNHKMWSMTYHSFNKKKLTEELPLLPREKHDHNLYLTSISDQNYSHLMFAEYGERLGGRN